MTLNEDLARAENHAVLYQQLLLMMLMTITVSISFRLVGILLITALLIIPPATARLLAKSPSGMALAASLIGVMAVILGIYASFYFDTPSGPSIVTVIGLIFLSSVILKKIIKPH